MMKSYIVRLITVSFFVILGVSCQAKATNLSSYVEKAAAIDVVRIEATGQRFEHQQTIAPGAPARHASNYDLITHWAPERSLIKEQWNLRTIYPFPNNLNFTAIYHENTGVRNGRDGFRPNPGGLVTPARIGAVTKDLWLTNPLLLLAHNQDSASKILKGQSADDSYVFSANDTQWRMRIDPETSLPVSIETTEDDPLEVTITNSINFSDWRDVDGVPFPFRLEQFVDGRSIRREVRKTIKLVSEDGSFDLPAGTDASVSIDASEYKRGWSQSHFYLRRALIGGPSDGNEAAKVSIDKITDGIYQVTGSSHHTLIVEGSDGLAIVDAVWYPSRSYAILKKMEEKWPNKPIRYVVLTHHHIDHVGGLRPFANLDVTIVSSDKNTQYFSDVLSKTIENPPAMEAVQERLVLNGLGDQPIELFDIPNSHANDMIGIYVPSSKTVLNSDLYSPGRPAQQKVWAGELASAILFHGLDVESHVGAHGKGSEPHANLLAAIK